MACTLNRKGHHILSLTQKLHSQIFVLLQLMLGLKNIPGGVLVIKVLLASFRPKKVDNETFENV
jgi:hypothetical protein